MNKQVFKVPNSIICNEWNLPESAIRVAVTFLGQMNKHCCFIANQKTLAKMSNCCVETFRNAVKRLEDVGFLQVNRKVRYDKELQKNVNEVHEYFIKKPVTQKYTLIPRWWLKCAVTGCQFQLALICRLLMGNKGRSYPSYKKLSNVSSMALSTIALAVTKFKECGMLVVQQCKKQNNCLTCNSYYILWQEKVSEKSTCQLIEKSEREETALTTTTMLVYQMQKILASGQRRRGYTEF